MPVIGNGVEICTSTTRPTNPVVGTFIYETDTASYRWCSQISPSVVWVGLIPVGTVQPYAGTTAPVGWLLCAGQTLNASTNTQYADLWSIIGTTYGGTGISSFNLPDLRGRAPFGKDDMSGSAASRITNSGTNNSGIAGTTLGASGGDQRMQSHGHTQNSHGHTADVRNDWVGAGNSSIQGSAGAATWGSVGNVVGRTATNQTTGTGGAQNMPPALILNYIIKF